jgi:hypothetical protein
MLEPKRMELILVIMDFKFLKVTFFNNKKKILKITTN